MMTRTAQQNEVSQLIGGFPISTKISIWLYVMNVNDMIAFTASNAAYLASMIISNVNLARLTTPVLTTFWYCVALVIRISYSLFRYRHLRILAGFGTILSISQSYLMRCGFVFFSAMSTLANNMYFGFALRQLGLPRSILRSTLCRTKARMTICPSLKLLSTPFTHENTFVLWINTRFIPAWDRTKSALCFSGGYGIVNFFSAIFTSCHDVLQKVDPFGLAVLLSRQHQVSPQGSWKTKTADWFSCLDNLKYIFSWPICQEAR